MFRVVFQPSRLEVQVTPGTTIFAAALEAGLRLITPCGGEKKCGKCRVRVLEGTVRAASQPLLSERDVESGYCLACMTEVESDLVVDIPRELESHSTAGTQTFLSMEDLLDSVERMGEWANGRKGEKARGRKGEKAKGRKGDKATGRSGGQDIVGGESFPRPQQSLGLALDIGTTVVAGALFDLDERELLAEAAAENRQAAHGADIIHRINFAVRKKGLGTLQRLGLETIEGVIESLLAATGESIASIDGVTAAGNTTMAHLLLGMDPAWIQTDPLPPPDVDVPHRNALESGFPVHPSAPLWISPWVGNYLGGDITAGVLYTRMWNEEPLTLYVDLGTNGEIVLGNREWMAGCACSCGPAFEGSGVCSGMRAMAGAIDSVKIDSSAGELFYTTIGDADPSGICGSGLVDVLAELRAAGLIDQKGKFTSKTLDESDGSDPSEGLGLVGHEDTAAGSDIVITQRDLEHLIRSKGAAYAGVRTLLKNLDIAPDAIERVVIAGGFGRSLNIDNAIAIGMLPDLPRERFSYIGNGSLKGAALALLWDSFRDRIDEIAAKITYVDLSTAPGYMEEFVAALFLPHTDAGLFPTVR